MTNCIIIIIHGMKSHNHISLSISRVLLPNATFGSSSFIHPCLIVPWDVSQDVRSGFLEDSNDRWLHALQTEALLSGNGYGIRRIRGQNLGSLISKELVKDVHS